MSSLSTVTKPSMPKAEPLSMPMRVDANLNVEHQISNNGQRRTHVCDLIRSRWNKKRLAARTYYRRLLDLTTFNTAESKRSSRTGRSLEAENGGNWGGNVVIWTTRIRQRVLGIRRWRDSGVSSVCFLVEEMIGSR